MRLVAPLNGSTQSICHKLQTSDGVRATENTIATGASGLLADWPEREPTSAWIPLGGIRGWPLGPFRRPSIRAICVFRPGTGMSAALVSLLMAVEPNSPTRRWPRDAQTKKNKAAA